MGNIHTFHRLPKVILLFFLLAIVTVLFGKISEVNPTTSDSDAIKGITTLMIFLMGSSCTAVLFIYATLL